LKLLNETKYKIDWNPLFNETKETSEFRKLIISTLGYFGDTETIEKSKIRFSQIMDSKNYGDELFDQVLEIVISNSSSDSEYIQMLNLYENTASMQFLKPLARTNSFGSISNTLNMVSKVKNNFELVLKLMKNPISKERTWESLRENSNVFNFYSESFLMQNQFKIIRDFQHKLQQIEIQKKFKDQILFDYVDSNLNFLRENYLNLEQWLTEK
jgi:hypothetical protein